MLKCFSQYFFKSKCAFLQHTDNLLLETAQSTLVGSVVEKCHFMENAVHLCDIMFQFGHHQIVISKFEVNLSLNCFPKSPHLNHRINTFSSLSL